MSRAFAGFHGMGSVYVQAQEGACSLHEAGTVFKLAFFVIAKFQCAHVWQGIDYLESHEIDERFAHG